MICPSKLSPGQMAKFTDEELIELYMQETMRWKDKYGREWMVFRRHAEVLETAGGFRLKPTSIDLVNILTESRITICISLLCQRIRSKELFRIYPTCENSKST